MLLSQKINQLREDVNEQISFNDEIMDGFNRCVEDAEFLEKQAALLSEIEKGIEEMYEQNDLITIGEFVLDKLGLRGDL